MSHLLFRMSPFLSVLWYIPCIGDRYILYIEDRYIPYVGDRYILYIGDGVWEGRDVHLDVAGDECPLPCGWCGGNRLFFGENLYGLFVGAGRLCEAIPASVLRADPQRPQPRRHLGRQDEVERLRLVGHDFGGRDEDGAPVVGRGEGDAHVGVRAPQLEVKAAHHAGLTGAEGASLAVGVAGGEPTKVMRGPTGAGWLKRVSCVSFMAWWSRGPCSMAA